MKENNATELAHCMHHLEKMLELTNDPKFLWEEMQILGKKAFTLQEKMEKLLDALEKETKEVSAVQTIFETREKMWDMMNQLAQAELKLKEKTLTKKAQSCCHKHKDYCCHEKNENKCSCKGEKCKKK